MNALELTGRARSHIVQNEKPRFAAGKETRDAFFSLKNAAARQGFDLFPFSAFRDFDSQLKIWNMKVSGKRPLYDSDGVLLDHQALSPSQLISGILSWSALPGGSRHHWGTEIDVIDASALTDDYQVQLLPEEYEKEGIFYDMHCWLNENLETHGFFRPYAQFRGGVNTEPWHISYRPVSSRALKDLDIEMIREAILTSDLMGKELLLEKLPFIFSNYILNICD